MTGRRNIIIAVGAIVVFAAIVGFFITLDVSPQIAYARLFIDLGLAIGLVAVIMAFYREKSLPTEAIVQALKSLKAGKFKTRITVNEQTPFADIANTINDLAKTLELDHKKQEEIKRNLREELLPGIKQKEAAPTLFDHSIHPELGPVCTLPQERKATNTSHPTLMVEKIPEIEAPQPKEQKFRNALIDSKPPEEKAPLFAKVETQAVPEQDLGELYQRFIDAQRAIALDQIEYPTFLNTIETTRNELIKSYKCRQIFFDIVSEANQVALQPKIIR